MINIIKYNNCGKHFWLIFLSSEAKRTHASLLVDGTLTFAPRKDRDVLERLIRHLTARTRKKIVKLSTTRVRTSDSLIRHLTARTRKKILIIHEVGYGSLL